MKVAAGQEETYQEWLDKNKDFYGKETLTYAERWAELLEKKINEIGNAEKAIMESAEYLSNEADINGITGHMYICSVRFLSACWEYGNELRKWWHKVTESRILSRKEIL